jgi:hypothetical protein
MTDWTPEEDEAFNDVEKHSNLGKQILREIGQPYHFQKREWVGLTDEHKEGLVCMTDPNPEPHHLRELIDVVEYELKKRNT